MAQLMPLPLTVSCFSKIQIGFAFLVPAHPGSPGQRAVKQVCVLHSQFRSLTLVSKSVECGLKEVSFELLVECQQQCWGPDHPETHSCQLLAEWRWQHWWHSEGCCAVNAVKRQNPQLESNSTFAVLLQLLSNVIMSSYSNHSDSRHHQHHTDWSVVFARCAGMHPHIIHWAHMYPPCKWLVDLFSYFAELRVVTNTERDCRMSRHAQK